jgi:hypothetical protein
MAINIINPHAPGQAHVDSYWAATGGPEITDATPVSGDKFGVTSHVLEANRIGWGRSGRNGGFATLGIGKARMAGRIRRWGETEARRLLAEEGIDADASRNGYLELAHLPNRMRGLAPAQPLPRFPFSASRCTGQRAMDAYFELQGRY